ncbi:hypothetical protein Vadar_032668 [Vaccinium darrowii]|uniref:Uncharacterized protein n=1 Tax=Vaccinium darrowii TaxID=229202 RepID=A0ACB7YRM9_9ERIC|nr:hypothetical protein Vadar_032668 [Vaccinium darrowii]
MDSQERGRTKNRSLCPSLSSLETALHHPRSESGREELRKEARKIESNLNVKLSSYAKLSTRFSQGGYVDGGSPSAGSSRSWKSMEMEIQSLIEKLVDINDAMSRCAASATPTSSVALTPRRNRTDASKS